MGRSGSCAADLTALRLPLLLRRLPAESPTAEAVRRAFGRRALVLTRPVSSAPFLRLGESWQEPERNLGSRRRSDLRRARRRAESAGEDSFEILCPEPDLLDPLLDEVFRVEAAGWKGETGTALTTNR